MEGELSELWLPLPGYRGMYAISSRGRVRSMARPVLHRGRCLVQVAEKRISTRGHINGYRRFDTHKKGVRKTWFVHVAVASAFLPNRKKKRYVNHVNGVKDDNRLENLEWSTEGENVRHFYAMKKKNA